MPVGSEKRAALPVPSVRAFMPAVPASVDTVPSVATRRMTWFWVSAT